VWFVVVVECECEVGVWFVMCDDFDFDVGFV